MLSIDLLYMICHFLSREKRKGVPLGKNGHSDQKALISWASTIFVPLFAVKVGLWILLLSQFCQDTVLLHQAAGRFLS